MKSRDFRVVADFNLRIAELPELLNGLDIRCAHIGGRDKAQFPAIFGEVLQLVHHKPQATPFDKRDQDVNAIAGYDLLFELAVHLWLMYGSGEET